jgi:photosystem II stability/assembly factor-like uncharacterized protein
MVTRLALAISLVCVSLTIVFAAQQAKTGLPLFTIKWQQGHCVGCQTARDNITVLDKIRFTSRTEAWALGVSFPVREGVPDYTVLHTSDSGRTWAEVTRAVQTSWNPSLSFSDSANGWIASWNFTDRASLSRAELIRHQDPELVRTKDGGQHWEKVTDRFFDWIQFFPNGLGYGTAKARFLKTNDGGETWTVGNLLELSSVSRALFISPQIGWMAGWTSNSVVVYRTVDGGITWRRSEGLPDHTIRDLWFYDNDRGWVIVQTAFDNEPYLFKTVDSGKTWRPESDRLFRGIHHRGDAVRFVSKDTGFVFEGEVTYTTSEPRAPSNTLRYTTDAGAHWNSQPFYYAVEDCQVFEGDLLCAASPRNRNDFGILTLHLPK